MKLKQLKTIVVSFILILLVLIPSPLFVGDVVKADAVPPTIIINFAGNLSDSGGPYWRPPGESDILDEAGEGIWRDGYYTNDSRQSEGWMYINLSVEDNGGVPNVWLQWKNDTTWTNYTYAFLNTTGGFFEFNTSGNLSTGEGYDYSFNIVANDTIGNSKNVWWNKTGIGGNYTRRHVQLNCTPVSITYQPYYYYHITTPDTDKYDRLHHDQGTDYTDHDAAYLRNVSILSDSVQNTWCGSFFANWFDESVCVEPFELENIYLHIWWSGDENELDETGWRKHRDFVYAPYHPYDYFNPNISNSRSSINYDGATANDLYRLGTSLIETASDSANKNITDNNIYEINVYINSQTDIPSIISNRSFTSFVLFNVPDNATLNASHADTDSDSLSDWTELYVTYTNPFLADTDNDSVSDYDESLSGSDPNNYTDTIVAPDAIGYPDGYFYFETEAPHANSLAVAYDETWHYYQMS